MSKRCPICGLINFHSAVSCARCDTRLDDANNLTADRSNWWSRFAVRALVCFFVCIVAILGFYLSLIASAKPLTFEQKATVRTAIGILKEKGFSREAMLLEDFTIFRADDNWLNASVPKENAYAATNFPFEIMTLYPDFFTYPVDDTERAAILLHEARHLAGKDEKDAYAFVWKNRKRLGWTEDKYRSSVVWRNVRDQTRDNAPNIFVCDSNEFGDCTQ